MLLSRWMSKRAAVASAVGISLLLVGCSSDSIDPSGLLLEPADFPSQELGVESRSIGKLFTGMKSPKITMKGPDFTLIHIYTVFDDPERAKRTIPSIMGDYPPEGVDLWDTGELFAESVMVRGDQGAGQAVSLFFRDGNVVSRVWIRGKVKVVDVFPFAEKAREKIRSKYD